MPVVIDGPQQTKLIKTLVTAKNTSVITKGKPAMPKIVNGLTGGGLGGATGQLSSQSIQLQGGVSFWNHKIKIKVTINEQSKNMLLL